MTLRIIGAGLPRTGTTSLKAAFEQLTGERCYHMMEFFPQGAEHGPLFWKAFDGDFDTLDTILADYSFAVDWPISLFWRELAERHPDAKVLLSHRRDADAWWGSVDRTVWEGMRRKTDIPGWDRFAERMRDRAGLGSDWDDESVAKAHYQALIDEVTTTVPADRLIMWQPGDGWDPLADALGVDSPDEPFPHANDTAEFRAQSGWDA